MLDQSFELVRPGGRLVTLSGPPPTGKADEYGFLATFFIVTPNRSQLGELAALVDGGRLRVEIAQTFGLHRGREAFESAGNPTAGRARRCWWSGIEHWPPWRG